ncbi:MAG: hypothetical protein D3916_03255 [Candidatus Electrothrix sp. MAN1_4]|nr:hypothetical protein [Candidatus Electrothrix sp. MAN1_4]
MLDKIKSGTVKVALALTFVASAYSVSNAQSVEIPMGISDQPISDVMSTVKPDGQVRAMMNEVRASVIEGMVNRQLTEMPLYSTIMQKMQPQMMARLMQIQAPALMNPNGGVPNIIAPPPF